MLLAFGLDSVIELASAGVLMWRLSVELRHGQVFSRACRAHGQPYRRRLAVRLGELRDGSGFWHLWKGSGEEFSWPGFIVALAAIPSMRWLARHKIAIAEKIGSRALRADAIEATTCGWLSFVVSPLSAAQWLFGVWWIDGIGSLAIVSFLVKEGREAWSGQACDAC